MRKRGKFEAPAPKKGSPLLQSYLVSLLCLVMCAVMFLGTTMAWFTSDVTSSGNQIHIGTLKADLYHEGVKINDNPEHQIFDSTIKWGPGDSVEETLTIKNEGDLPFRYALSFCVTPTVTETENALTAEQIQQIASCFEVSYSTVVDQEEVWQIVTNSDGTNATLAQILAGGIPVFQGEMAPEETEKVHKIRLSFKETDVTAIMDKTLRIDVQLVASQLVQESEQEEQVQQEPMLPEDNQEESD